MKAALGIMTTDLTPKLAMEECKIGNHKVKIYGIAKGSGMIFPNMATMLAFVFTDYSVDKKTLTLLTKKAVDMNLPLLGICNLFLKILSDILTRSENLVV